MLIYNINIGNKIEMLEAMLMDENGKNIFLKFLDNERSSENLLGKLYIIALYI